MCVHIVIKGDEMYIKQQVKHAARELERRLS